MIIKIDFYKPSGKWYAGGTVDIPAGSYLHTNGIRELVYERQEIVSNPSEFTTVVDNTNDDDPFFKAIWQRNNK